MEEECRERLRKIKKRIETAASRVDRDPTGIKIIAVSKNHPFRKIKLFQSEGIEIFGENRVQELLEKDEDLNSDVVWHFIGHLQRNKVKYLLRMDNIKLIHSVDSWRLAKEINKRAKINKKIMPVLMEINIADDENKYGLRPEETLSFLQKTSELSNLEVQGLMTIIPYVDDPEKGRTYFRQMADLKAEANQEGYHLTELSMGMTNDFEVAIEEGATMVRIGTALFGEREY